MVSITFYGGVSEIGGNKILVQDGDTRVFLDFGKSFGVWGKYFEEFLQPTASKGIEPFLKTGLLPDIKGAYRPDLLEFSGIKAHDEPIAQAVLLSHAHQDHASYISFLDERMPVYCSEITKTVLEAIETVGQATLENEVTQFKKRPSKRGEDKTLRNVQTVSKVKIGNIEAEFVPVDHSIPGACGIILHCSDDTIIYSGDIRLHGTFGHLTGKFAEKSGHQNADVFLCEGTRVTATENYDEAYVHEHAGKIISKSKGLALADFSWKDTTRLLTFFELAKETNRKLLIPIRTAYYLERLQGLIPGLPKINDENLLLYQERCMSGTFTEMDYKIWQRPYLERQNTVQPEYVKAHQDEILACFGFFDMIDLVDIAPKPGSAYVHSTSEPYHEEQEFNMDRLQNWLKLYGLPYQHAHASGHAPQQDLFQVVKTVAPKMLIPIHTQKPGEFKKTGFKLKLAKKGKEIKL